MSYVYPKLIKCLELILCVHACMCVCVCVHACVLLCVRVRMHACVSVRACVCMHACVHAWQELIWRDSAVIFTTNYFTTVINSCDMIFVASKRF